MMVYLYVFHQNKHERLFEVDKLFALTFCAS